MDNNLKTQNEGMSGRLQEQIVHEKNEKLITIDQACEVLHVSKVTIHSWKKKGLIPFYRLGRRVYFKVSELIGSTKRIHIKSTL